MLSGGANCHVLKEPEPFRVGGKKQQFKVPAPAGARFFIYLYVHRNRYLYHSMWSEWTNGLRRLSSIQRSVSSNPEQALFFFLSFFFLLYVLYIGSEVRIQLEIINFFSKLHTERWLILITNVKELIWDSFGKKMYKIGHSAIVVV